MQSRLKLHNELLELCKNAYFQPPDGMSLKYPCIVYSLSKMDTKHANNKIYKFDAVYDVQVLSQNPDDELPMLVLNNFNHCDMGRVYKTNGKYSFNFTLYY